LGNNVVPETRIRFYLALGLG